MAWSGRGFFRQYHVQEQEQEQAYFPCAPGCRASDSDPRYCKCVCRGINHGILIYGRPERPIPVPRGFNPSFPLLQNPEYPQLEELKPEEPKPHIPLRQQYEVRPIAKSTGRALKRIGKSFAKAMNGGKRSETELNEEILSGLRKQFSEERVNAIVDEAFTEHFSRVPDSNRPELYELYESGYVDNVLERRNIRWVIGRPKRK